MEIKIMACLMVDDECDFENSYLSSKSNVSLV